MPHFKSTCLKEAKGQAMTSHAAVTTTTSDSGPSVANHTSVLEDSWELNKHGQVVRTHHVPRWKRFSPIGVPGCPVDIRNLGVERTTFARFESGETWNEKGFWPGTRGHASLPALWTGKTTFEVRGV